MRHAYLPFVLTLVSSLAVGGPPNSDSLKLQKAAESLRTEILQRGTAYANLTELTSLGHRLSGTAGAARAVTWAKAKLESLGLDKVWLQPVQVPHWERGNIEEAIVIDGKRLRKLAITALGNSVGTDDAGIEAEVVEVKSLDDVAGLSDAVRGKIVFYNRAMDPSLSDTFRAYSGAVDQRTRGASQAARFGARAVVVRSLSTLPDDDHPHTGGVFYTPNLPKIPAVAVSTHGANELAKFLAHSPHLRLKLRLSAQTYPDAPSFNVIGELKGATLPDEIVDVSGHLDSWDLARGAHDDGAGVVQSIEVVRAIHALKLRPSRTIRAVLFMSEEFGGIGGQEYARQARDKAENHIAALESDCGGYAPVGFTVDGSKEVLAQVRAWRPFFQPLHADRIVAGGSGTDVEPLSEELGIPSFGFTPDPKHYFDLHHSALDVLSAVNAKELSAGAAAQAIFTYLVAEQGLPPSVKTKSR
jgi:hypothetical protein